MIVDSSARCCCQKAGAPLPPSATQVIVVTNAASTGAYPVVMPPPQAYEALPPGWAKQSDGSGAVWYTGPNGESQWTPPGQKA